jgi:hypothetical protein
MMFRPVPSRGRTGRIVAPCCHSRGDCNPVEGVVGHVRQVDPEAHPYPPHLLLGPAGTQGLASRPACRLGKLARVRRSPIGFPGQSLGTDLASDRSHSRGYGPWSSRPSCLSGLWAQMKLLPHTDGCLFQALLWTGQ